MVVVLSTSGLRAVRPGAQLNVSAVTASLTSTGTMATAKFVLHASSEDAAVSGITVVFSETYSVALGDAAAGATVKSEPQQLTIDMSGVPTKSVHLPVTVKYTVDGAPVSQAVILNFGVIQ
jgi:hypothetical protein